MFAMLGSYSSPCSPQIACLPRPLCPPPCLLTFPRNVRQCLAPNQVLAHLKINFGLLLPICSAPSFAHSHTGSLLAGWLGVDFMEVWCSLNCESPVTSPHHALMQHGCLSFSAIPLFLCLSFFGFVFRGWEAVILAGSRPPAAIIDSSVFFWGWEAVNPGQVRGPPAAIIDSFYRVVLDSDKFCNEMD